jgi:hypothetical protein
LYAAMPPVTPSTTRASGAAAASVRFIASSIRSIGDKGG